MTADHNQPEDQITAHKVDEQPDPIGPITVSTRSRVGARAFALVGAASALAVGVVQFADACGTVPTSVSAPH
jgi:hypothetical protein